MSRSCVVTGGAGSIGQAIVSLLRTENWDVVSLDLRECPSTQTGAIGGLSSVIGDVSERSSHERALERAQQFGVVEGWVNCAGYNILGSVIEVTDAELTRGVGVNLLGVFLGTAVAVGAMIERSDGNTPRGAIVNISSIQASVGFLGFSAYAMTKGGIESLTHQVAAEYVTSGIRCNAVAPGLIVGDMSEKLVAESDDPELILSAWRQITPMGRWGTPTDVANAVSFLLGDRSSFITGEVLAVNGGALTLAPGQLQRLQ